MIVDFHLRVRVPFMRCTIVVCVVHAVRAMIAQPLVQDAFGGHFVSRNVYAGIRMYIACATTGFNHNKLARMPSKLVQCRWLCDYCRRVFDTDLECILHEREVHRLVPTTMSDYDTLQAIYTRLTTQPPGDQGELDNYEHMLKQMHETVRQMKVHAHTGATAVHASTGQHAFKCAVVHGMTHKQHLDNAYSTDVHVRDDCDDAVTMADALNEQVQPFQNTLRDYAEDNNTKPTENIILRSRRTVSAARNFQCDMCSKAFHSSTNLVTVRVPAKCTHSLLSQKIFSTVLDIPVARRTPGPITFVCTPTNDRTRARNVRAVFDRSHIYNDTVARRTRCSIAHSNRIN